MRTRQRAAYGAALLYVLTASAALSCPVASDIEGAGIRFIGADGADVVHRRLDANRVQADYIFPDEPGASRSILIHGVYVQWFGQVDGAGAVLDDSSGVFVRSETPEQMPMPEVGMTWRTDYVFQDGGGQINETMEIAVRNPTTWQLGTCSYDALPVETITTLADGYVYREFMTYLPDFGTAVLVGYTDSDATDVYEYVDIAVEGS